MKKYELTIVENNSYIVTVEAENEAQAKQMYSDGLIELSYKDQIDGENYVDLIKEIK